MEKRDGMNIERDFQAGLFRLKLYWREYLVWMTGILYDSTGTEIEAGRKRKQSFRKPASEGVIMTQNRRFFVLLLVAAVGCSLGCRLIGGYGNDPEVNVGGGEATVLTGSVALTGDVEQGLLAGVRGGLASGTSIGKQIPFSGLKAQLFSYEAGATVTLTLPVDVSASGTFSLAGNGFPKNLFVRVFNSSGTLVLLAVVNSPVSGTTITVSERSTAIGLVIVAAAGSKKLLLASDVEAQVSQNVLSAITTLIAAGLRDPVAGTGGLQNSALVTTAADQTKPMSTGGGTASPTGPTWPANVLAGTALNSPVLAALAGQYGQTARAALASLSASDLDQAVRAAVAVGIDLSAMTPAEAAANPLIQMALRVGTPIVFENLGALTQLPIPGGTGDSVAAMAAALGMGIRAQIALAVPSNYAGQTELYCFGGDGTLPVLPLGVVTGVATPSGLPIVSTDTTKLPGISTWSFPLPSASQMAGTIKTLLGSSLRQQRIPNGSIRGSVSAPPLPLPQASVSGTPPTGVTKKEFVIKWGEFVWYPRDRGQDFVIQCSLRVQMFQGQGGEKKWVRFIVDDAGSTAGFLNRGALYFRSDHDKGYFIGGAQVKLTTPDSWVTLEQSHPAHVNAGIPPDGPNNIPASEYHPAPTTSVTAFDVDYLENGVRKTWRSEESRQFQMDEFELNPGTGAEWNWRLFLCYAPDHGDNNETKRIRKLGYLSDRPGSRGQVYWDWGYMAEDVGDNTSFAFEHDQTIGWPMRMSRGTDQTAFHPQVQACYSVTGNETRSTQFTLRLVQEVWNVWSDDHDHDYRAVYSAQLDRGVSVDFQRMKGSSPIWATNTSGNPGARKVMQSDGNLVIYSQDGRALWASNTGGSNGAKGAVLEMQSDGNLVIYSRKALWATNTSGNPGAYKRFQSDGNLVIYSSDGRPLWASGTSGNPGATCTMQGDGNLVIKAQDGRVLWAAGTGGNNGAKDIMQDDGNYVIYDNRPVWASNTSGNPGAYDVMQNDGNYVIYAGN